MRKNLTLRKLWLSLLLLVGASTVAFAQKVAKVGGTEYATIEEAVANWGPGKTLTLLADVTTTSTVEVEVNATKSTQGWTLNLGDYTWTTNGCNAIHLFADGGTPIHQNYGLKINANQSGGITASGKYAVSYTNQGTCSDSRGYRPRLEINGGTYNASFVVYYGTSAYSSTANGASVFINKSADGTEPVFNGNFGLSKCPVTVNAGYFNGTRFTVYRVSSTVEPNIYGGHFKTYSAFPVPGNDKGIVFGNYKVFVRSDASIDMTNGAPATYEAKATKTLLLSTNQGKQYNDYIYYEKANDAIQKYSSGTIEIVLASGVTATQDKTLSSSGTLTIDATAEGSSYTGNVVLANNSAKLVMKFPEGGGHYGVSVNSGTLHVEESVVDGIVTRTYSRIATISDPEAKVGDTGYSTVYDAFYAIDGSTDNKTIVLQKDVTNAGIVTNGTATGGDGKTVATFDLNGKSIGIGSVAAGNNADYTLTIIDSSEGKTGTVTNSDASLFILALTGISDYSGSYTLKVQAGTWQFDPSAVNINGETRNLVDEGYVARDNGDGTWTVVETTRVAQIGTTKYSTLQAAVDAAQEMGGAVTVNIINDISGETVTIQEVANFKLTIDGKKDDNSNYTVDALIIVDGKRGNGGGTTNGASVTLQNIAFVKTTATNGIEASHYAHNLTIQDCTYIGSDNNKWFLDASVDGPLYGVTVKNVTVEHARLIYANMADDAVFQNITATTDCKVGFNVKTSGTALIENCQVTTGKYAFRDYNDGYAGTFTLKDNTFVSTSEESDEGAIVNRGGSEGTAHVNVESGTYTGHLRVLSGKEGVLAISGGYFSEEFPQSYIAADLDKVCVPATDMEGYFTIGDPHYVAQIGITKYVSLAAAVEAAQANDVITMIDDDNVSLTAAGSEVTIDKPLTITGAVDESGKPKFTIFGSTNGALNNNSFNDLFLSCSTGTVTISNLKFDGFGNEISSAMGHSPVFIGSRNQNAVIENVYISNLNCEGIHINGGTFTIKDCNIDCSKTTNSIFTKGICVVNAATGSIENTTITGVDCNDANDTSAAIELQGSGEIVISGCTIESETMGIAADGPADQAGSSSVTVSGCTVEADLYALYGNGEKGAVINVLSGSYKGLLSADDEGAGLNISGGIFEDEPELAYCAEGFIPTANTDEATSATYPYTVKEGSYVAEIEGGAKYETLEAAIAAAPDGATVTLLANSSGNGIQVPQGKYSTGLTVDFGGFTYTMDGEMVGSTGTQTQAFQLLKDNKITFKNGTITSEKAKMLVQNYSDLTLEGMTLTLNNANYTEAYTLSNNNGNVVIDGTTINANPAGGYAFDVCRYASYPSVSVTVKGESVIKGDVQVDAGSGDPKDGLNLLLEAGTFSGIIELTDGAKAALTDTEKAEKTVITKSNSLTSVAAPQGYKWVDNGDETSTLAPCVYVAQIGDVKYETLADAVAAVPADGTATTITMIADEAVVAGVTIAANQNVVLELNGKTVSGNTDSSKTYALITNKGTLVIQDNTDTNLDGTGTGLITTYISNPDGGDVPGYASNTITNNGNLTVKSGKIVNNGAGYACFAIDNQTNGNLYNPILIIDGGRMQQMNEYTYAVRMFANSTTNVNTCEVSGGVIEGGYGLWLQTPNDKANKADLKITGGTINANDGAALYIGGTKADNSNISIDIAGGQINGTGVIIQGPLSGTYGSVSISDGKIINVQCGANVEHFISGGIFKEKINEAYIANGYIPTANTDEATMEAYPYTVKSGAYVAAIGDVKYETLEEAIEAATDGANTITLLADIDMGNASVNIDKAVTINGDGYTISSAAAQAFFITGSGDVTIANTKVTASNGHGIQTGDDNNAYSGKLTVSEGSVLTVAKRGINVWNAADDFALEVNGSTIQSNVEDPTTTFTTGNDARGINLIGSGYNVTLTNATVQGFAYNVNVPTSGTNLTVDITGGTYNGWSFINNWGSNNTFNVTGATAACTGLPTGDSNSFSAIIDNVGSTNNAYTLTDCTFSTAPQGETIREDFLDLRGTNAIVKVLGSTTYTTSNDALSNFIYSEVELFTNKLYFDDTTKDTFANAFEEAVIADEKDAEVNLYPVTFTPEVYYYWDNGNGGYEGVYCDFVAPFEDTANYILGDGEFIALQKNVTLDHNITNPLEEGTINLILGDFNITKGDYSVKLALGQSVNTDKQTDIFSTDVEDYKVVETATENGFVYSLAPKTYVAQIGDVKYESLADAVAAVPANGTETTITMIANEMINVSGYAITIPATKNVVLDLNGYQVVGTVEEEGTSALIRNLGTLTIKDSSDTNKDGTGTGKLMSGANTTWTWDGTENYAGSYASNLIRNEKDLIVESGNLYNMSSGSAAYAIDNYSAGNITINGGKVDAAKASAIRLFYPSGASVTVNDGIIGGENNYMGIQVQAGSNANVSVNGGTISGQYALYGTNSNGSVSISGGTFYGYVGMGSAYKDDISITDGAFNDWVGTWGTQTKFISGGIYAIEVDEEYIADGCILTNNTDPATKDDYPYAVRQANYICAIGTTKYETLADAVAAAGTAETTITLLTEAATDGVISGDGVVVPSGSNITFDLNGLTYDVSGETVGSSNTKTLGFQLLKESNITFKNGTLKATSPTAKMLIQNYSNLTLENVNLDGTGLSGVAYALSNNCGTINLTGSTSITAKTGGRAFDTCKFGSYAIPTVNINTTGSITGPIEATGGKLKIENGKFDVTWATDNNYAAGDIQIKGGVFAEEPDEEYLAENYVVTENKDAATSDAYPYTVKTKEDAGIFELIHGVPYPYPEGRTATSVTYRRTFERAEVGNYRCWYVPFDYTIKESDEENFTFYKIHMIAASGNNEGGVVENTDAIYIYLKPAKAGDILHANRPYVVVAKEAKEYIFTTEESDLYAEDNSSRLHEESTWSNYDFYGTYREYGASAGYEWYTLTKSGHISPNASASAKLQSYVWALKVSSRSENENYSKINFIITEESDEFNGIATDLSSVLDQESEIEGIYTTDGVKVDHVVKGVNVIRYKDGRIKKVSIK